MFLSYWKTPDLHLVPEYFYKKKNYIKELYKKSFEKILNWIMQNFAQTQKRIVYAFIKTLRIKLLPSSEAM